MSAQVDFQPGSIVAARGREWIVFPESNNQILHLRPMGSAEDDKTIIFQPLEPQPVEQAHFPLPNPKAFGTHSASRLLRDAMMLKLRSGAGPFRSFGNIAVEPRAYQLVPLLMAMKHETVRLLIADDVGIGKTIEAGLIARELMDRGEIKRLSVLCPPHLCEQWQDELEKRFNIRAAIVRTSTASRLEFPVVPTSCNNIRLFPLPFGWLVIGEDSDMASRATNRLPAMAVSLASVNSMSIFSGFGITIRGRPCVAPLGCIVVCTGILPEQHSGRSLQFILLYSSFFSNR